jgi:hypothetical protein
MVFKNAIAKKAQGAEQMDIGEKEAPCDELDDLFELPAPIEHTGCGDQGTTMEEDNSEDEVQEHEVWEDSSSGKPPARKRRCPARYRDN